MRPWRSVIRTYIRSAAFTTTPRIRIAVGVV